MHAKMNVIAKISCYLERGVVTLKSRKEYLNSVTHNTSVLLWIKYWTVWCIERYSMSTYTGVTNCQKTVRFFGPPCTSLAYSAFPSFEQSHFYYLRSFQTYTITSSYYFIACFSNKLVIFTQIIFVTVLVIVRKGFKFSLLWHCWFGDGRAAGL